MAVIVEKAAESRQNDLDRKVLNETPSISIQNGHEKP